MTTQILSKEGSIGLERNKYYQTDARGIPFEQIEYMFAYLPYATHISVGVKLLFYTGCRICELDNMRRSNIKEQSIYWKLGKNQTGQIRKEYLPAQFIMELQTYWLRNPVRGDHVLGVKAENISSYFNKNIRPQLNEEWNDKIECPKINPKTETFEWSYEYKYQMKGFRKNWATLCFFYYYEQYRSEKIAGTLLSARMKHSCISMTFKHYFVIGKQINAEKYKDKLIFEVINFTSQMKVFEYC